jgi:hypothetical protein
MCERLAKWVNKMTTQPASGKKADEASTQEIPISATGREQDAGSARDEAPRKSADERPHAFNALAWLMEGATGLIEEVRHSDLGLSPEFWSHAYGARKESLLALRALLDTLIDRCESQSRQEEERQQRRERRGGIKIEF